MFSTPEPVRNCNYEHPLIPCDEIGGRCYEDMELLGTKWSRHLKSGDLIHRSMQVYCLGLDAIFLSEALDTVRSIILPCWAHYFSNLFSLSLALSHTLDKTKLFKTTGRQNSSVPSPILLRHQRFSRGNGTGSTPWFTSPSLCLKPTL